MFSQRELVLAIEDATTRTTETFTGLTVMDWAVPVQHEPMRTVRDVLAHLAGSGVTYALLIEIARHGVALEAFDWGEFLALRLADRATVSVAELLTQYRTVQLDLIRQIIAMDPDLLQRPVRIGDCRSLLDSALLRAGALHALEHRAQIVHALARARGEM
jgi:hypothetical protein